MDQTLEYTSPDYILEKYDFLIGVAPHNFFTRNPVHHSLFYKNLFPITKKEKEEYNKFLNIINFIENIDYQKHISYNLKIFKKYIGEVNNINDNSYYNTGIHYILKNYTEEYLKQYERYIKLLTL